MSFNLKNRSFLTLPDFTQKELRYLLDLSKELKAAKHKRAEKIMLTAKNIVLIFEKVSVHTRCAMEVAAFDQGAGVTYIGPETDQIIVKESVKNTARVLGRMYDAIGYLGHDQDVVESLARYSGVPVWNAITDEFNPIQMMADWLTMLEHCDKPLRKISFCYLGDARNNMCNTLMTGASKMGMDFRIAAPKQCQPKKELIAQCLAVAKETGSKITITEKVEDAVHGVDFVYTDAWMSKGEPKSTWAKRISLLQSYQVNKDVLELTENPKVRFMCWLPDFHHDETELGEQINGKSGIEYMEVTEDIFDSPASIVFDQAENLLHTVKALMVATLS